MEFPKRIDSHITETASFKIFNNVIPNSWIIREVTERDYGIDCYIEIVDEKQQVTGELVSIQIKGIRDGISWTKKNDYTFSGIKISTSNYWNYFPTPVFICLVDIHNNEVYFCPVKSEIIKNYFEYKKQVSFSYKISQINKLTLGQIKIFLSNYYQEKKLNLFEKEVVTFVSSYHHYIEFISANSGRDVFMGIENDRILFLSHMYDNIKFLYNYLDLNWDIASLKEYQKKSMELFGQNYKLYEQEMDEIVSELEKKMNPLMLKLKDIICDEACQFWMSKNMILFNVVSNAKDDGSLDNDW